MGFPFPELISRSRSDDDDVLDAAGGMGIRLRYTLAHGPHRGRTVRRPAPDGYELRIRFTDLKTRRYGKLLMIPDGSPLPEADTGQDELLIPS